MNTEPILYFDHAATTPTDPAVLEAMLPFLSGPLSCGNPSSIHSYGREARTAIDAARDSVARLIGADYSELYFTSSGTEADNLALLGVMEAASPSRTHLVTTAIEHHAVLHTAHHLSKMGTDISVIPVDAEGLVSPEAVAEVVTDRTALVSVMHANNEIGTLQPISEISQIAHSKGALCHTDAVQTAGLLSVDVKELGCDLLTLCAHKMYGPKGVGALYIRQGVKLTPILHGGTQEREKRAGTENVAAIVGFGKAAEIALARREEDAERLRILQEKLLTLLRREIPDVRLNGHLTQRLSNNVNISVPDVEGPTLLMNLDMAGVAASSGSACSSGSIEPSHVLKAIGLSDILASSGVRLTMGRQTTEDEVELAAARFGKIIRRLRRGAYS